MRVLSACVVLFALASCKSPAPDKTPPPAWVFPGDSPSAAVDGGAGSAVDLFAAKDSYPSEHAAMPDIVARGRKPDVFACAYCHLPTGVGRPENASLAGLPYGYLTSQLADMKSGKRGTSVPGRAPNDMMLAVARALTDDEASAAARYFSQLTPHSNVQIVETASAPKMIASQWVLTKDPAGAMEPVGARMLLVPETPAMFEQRDDHARFVAYVAPGSLKAGEALVSSGGPGKTTPCGTCHGSDLRGNLSAPRIAGLSPTYTARQLYDFKSAARTGSNAVQMRAVVYNLTEEDVSRISAYLATLPPR
jgi:cytochrome c553